LIVYVDLEHARLAKADPKLWHDTMSWRAQVKYQLEEIWGDECLLVRYDKVSPALLTRLGARAMVVSGNTTDFEHYAEEALSGLRAIYQEARLPILAFCGGFQLMGWGRGKPAT
jgi:hypothetical protein